VADRPHHSKTSEPNGDVGDAWRGKALDVDSRQQSGSRITGAGLGRGAAMCEVSRVSGWAASRSDPVSVPATDEP
jgi:hypothetical protein